MKLGAAIAMLLAASGIIGYQLTRETPEQAAANTRMLLCASQQKAFASSLDIRGIEPFDCEICDKKDAYLPEKCYWTKTADGKWATKAEPSYVILPFRLEEGGAKTTTCPDCGRTVVGHNPVPKPEDVERANQSVESSSSTEESRD